jgi:hypothetical protein
MGILRISSGTSSLIDIRRLERPARRLLYLGFLFAIIFHGLLGILITFMAPYQRIRPVVEKSEKPIPIEIIIITPRNTEPFKIREHRFEKKITLREDKRYRMPSKGIVTKEPSSLLGKEERLFSKEIPGIEKGMNNLMEPFLDSLPNDIGIQQGPSDRIPQRRDASRDPGMFRSDIIYNPDNKQSTQGYVHIPLIRIDDLGQPESMVLSLRGLVRGINRHTNITAVLDEPRFPVKVEKNSINFLRINELKDTRGIRVDSLFLFRPPLVYILADREFRFSESEKGSILKYLKGGGMLIMESGKPGDDALRDKVRGLMVSIFEDTSLIEVGLKPLNHEEQEEKNIPKLEPITGDHPIYHCFYDFENGPPEGAGQEFGAIPLKVQPCLEGIFYMGRLAAVFSDRGYGLCWDSSGNYDEQMKMGVNLILFALIQRHGQIGKLAKAER